MLCVAKLVTVLVCATLFHFFFKVMLNLIPQRHAQLDLASEITDRVRNDIVVRTDIPISHAELDSSTSCST